LARLEVLAPTLREQCARLATYRIPHTLMHGDMHGNNVAGRDGQYFFFDWTDACIAHPFLDMLVIHYAGEEARQAALQSSYLALWTQFEPLARVQEAWVLAQPLMCLHHAVSYLTIVAGIEPDARPDLDWGIAYWLEKLLAFFA
jgi:aminoglycoside phosphotransferase (APT) family kinase protein